MKLNRQLADIAHSRGINFFGVANLSPVYDTVLAQGGKFVAGFPFSISIGISLLDSIVDPAAKYVDDERLCAAFSHKLGAHLAGLG